MLLPRGRAWSYCPCRPLFWGQMGATSPCPPPHLSLASSQAPAKVWGHLAHDEAATKGTRPWPWVGTCGGCPSYALDFGPIILEKLFTVATVLSLQKEAMASVSLTRDGIMV